MKVIIGVMVLLGCLVIGENDVKEKPPTIPLPTGIQFDCVLLKYQDGAEHKLHEGMSVVLKTLDGGRVVSYPSGYTPILVPDSELPRLAKQLESRMVILRSGLE